MKRIFIRPFFVLLISSILGLFYAGCSKNNTLTLRGAAQFDESHVYSRTLKKFEELIIEYYGKPINFEIYLNSELGLEKDFFAYMSQGLSVDFAVVSPSHMSTSSKAAPAMDMPFLFQNLDRWSNPLSRASN